MIRAVTITTLLICSSFILRVSASPREIQETAAPVSFEREILPLLEERCNECHHPEETRGGLDLTRLSTMLRGGDELGPALVPGKPSESPLLEVLHEGAEYFMPKKRDPLPEHEIALLKKWIAEGAEDDTPAFPAEDIAFFEREIRPILFESCFKCHAGEDPESGLHLTSRHGILRGGDRGPAASPGFPSASRLIAAVKHEGKLKMPRGGDRLTDPQVAALETWVAKGLPWPDDTRVLTREKLFTISDADREHWAFRPLPKNPANWSLDATLTKHHQRAGLQPAGRADRHRLLRRLTYDLIGYPPTPKEIEDFVSDESPQAYENAVTRLLASPLFGQRWGRHWLDYTRNGANGQSNRAPDLNAARYEEWVARSLNEDRPYDHFARIHLAGDRMPAPDGAGYSIDQATAAAIPLNGPRTFQRAETETFVLMDKLDEGVEFLGRSLLGVSFECARCHDHKFDPVSQRDYYALLGFFQSSWHAPVPENASTLAEADRYVAEYYELLAERARLAGFIRKKGPEFKKLGLSGGVKAWKEARAPELAPHDKHLREIELAIFRGELAQAEKSGDAPSIADLRTATTERAAKLENHAPPAYTGFGSMGFYKSFISGNNTEVGLIARARDLGEEALVRALEKQLQFWEDERQEWVDRGNFGGLAKTDPAVADVLAAEQRIAKIDARLPLDTRKQWEGTRKGYRIVRAEGGLRRAEDLVPLDAEIEAAGLRITGKDSNRARFHPPYIGDARLLRRGDVLEPDDLVPRAFPEFFGAETPELEGSGRLELANWLTADDSLQSALLARAAVNRAWQNLFGEALCRTPKELGRLGHIPEMPDLLDGLAAHFIASGWSLKSLVRTIVTSDAYTRASAATDATHRADPHNRLFARQNVRRLQAEPIANTFATYREGTRFANARERDSALSNPDYFFTNFDGPSTDDLIDRRTASISATQALFLLNSSGAYSNASTKLEGRLRTKETPDLASILTPLYLEVLQRPPTDDDRAFAENFITNRRTLSGAENQATEIREFIHLLLCSNELLYIE